MIVKHFTSSVFVFGYIDGQWCLALIFHRKLKKWMIPGGHLEPNENPAEAATREVSEELGVGVRLLTLREDLLGDLNKQGLDSVLAPEIIFEELIPSGAAEQTHIHIDCLYWGIALQTKFSSLEIERSPAQWARLDHLGALDMFETTRSIALLLFDEIERRGCSVLLKHE